MQLTRRHVCIGVIAASAAGVLGVKYVRQWSTTFQSVIEDAFGPKVAQGQATQDFIAALAQEGHVSAYSVPREEIIHHFIRSTTVVRALELEEEPFFIALYNPYVSPCANPLSSNWL